MSAADAAASARDSLVSQMAKWIPGEVLGFYMLLTGFKDQLPSGYIFTTCALIALVMPFATTVARKTDLATEKWVYLWVTGILGVVAFAIWSVLVPSGLLNEYWKDHQAVAVTTAALLATVAGPCFEGISLRFDPDTAAGRLRIRRVASRKAEKKAKK